MENASWDDIHPDSLRAEAALAILHAEWDALFVQGEFDADPHPGNWLKDMAHERLVRGDYAQMPSVLQSDERNAFRQTMSALVYPHLWRREIDVLAKTIPLLFSMTDGDPGGLRNVLGAVVASAGFPGHKNFPDRLFYLREKIEEWYAANGQPAIKLRFKPNTRLMISAFLKTLDYRRHISPAAFMNALLPMLGVSRAGYMLRVMGSKLYFLPDGGFL